MNSLSGTHPFELETGSAVSPVDNVTARLQRVRTVHGGWLASCPVPGHGQRRGDRNPSLSISEGDDGRVLLKCLAGCDTAAVVDALGMTMRDLFTSRGVPYMHPGTTSPVTKASTSSLTLQELADAKKLPIAFLRDMGCGDVEYQGGNAVRMVYPNTDGTNGPTRYRMALEKLPQGGDRFRWMPGSKVQMLGLDRLDVARTAGSVVIVEGETCYLTLAYNVIPVVGVAGASNFRDDRDAKNLDGIDLVYAVVEPDQGGVAFRKKLGESSLRDRIRFIDLSPFGVGDVSDLWCDDPEQFRERFEQAIASATPWTDLEAALPEAEPGQESSVLLDTGNRIGAILHPSGRLDFLLPSELGDGGDVEWIVHGIVACGAISELVGKVKTAGKTTLALAATRAITMGAPFLQGACVEAPVIYLTEEGESSFRAALTRAGLIDFDRLHVLPWYQARGRSWQDVTLEVGVFARQIGARMVVVDTLSRWAGIRADDENSAGAGLDAMGPLRELADSAKVGVLTLRHGRKSGGDVGDDGRGSSAISGEADILLSLRRPEGNHAARPNLRELHGIGRFDNTPDRWQIELTNGIYQRVASSPAVSNELATRQLLQAMPDNPEAALTEEQLVEAAGVGRTTARRALAKLIESGAVKRVGDGKKGKPFRHWSESRSQTPPLVSDSRFICDQTLKHNSLVTNKDGDTEGVPDSCLTKPSDTPKPVLVTNGMDDECASELDTTAHGCVGCGVPTQNAQFCNSCIAERWSA